MPSPPGPAIGNRRAEPSAEPVVPGPTFYAQPLVDSGELVQVLQRYPPRFGVFAVQTFGVPAPATIRAFTALLKRTFARRLTLKPSREAYDVVAEPVTLRASSLQSR